MAIRYGRGDVKQTTTGFRGPLMVQSLTSAKSKFLSLRLEDAFMKSFGIKVQVALPGDRNLADNNATLGEVSRSK